MPDTRDSAWDFAACGLLVLAPLVSHMAYHGFDFVSVDAAGLLLPVLAIGLFLGWMVGRVPRAARTAILGALTVVFLDLELNIESTVSFWIPVVAGFLGAWILREHYTRIVTVTVAAMTAAVPFRPSLGLRVWTAASPVRTPTPGRIPIVHIVFDEHAAPKAFPRDITEAVQARDRILRFYREHGFRLYPNAFSRYHWSRTALPAMMNPGKADGSPDVAELDERHYLVTANAVFENVAAKGYRIHVVQTTYIDFCSGARTVVTSCRTYPVNSLQSLRLLPLTAHRRIFLEVAYFMVTESHLLKRVWDDNSRRRLASIKEDDPGTAVWTADKAGAGTALRALSQLRRHLATDLPGSYHFVHVLFPHSPYEVDRICRGLTSPRQRLTTTLPWSRRNTKASRRLRWALYSGQVQCLYAQLDGILAVVDSAASPQGVLVILQGDHGSRIARTDPDPDHREQLSKEDLFDSFATLLAVRGPGIPPGLDSAAVAIQEFVPALVLSGSLEKAPAGEHRPAVYLESWWFRTGRRVLVRAEDLAH